MNLTLVITLSDSLGKLLPGLVYSWRSNCSTIIQARGVGWRYSLVIFYPRMSIVFLPSRRDNGSEFVIGNVFPENQLRIFVQMDVRLEKRQIGQLFAMLFTTFARLLFSPRTGQAWKIEMQSRWIMTTIIIFNTYQFILPRPRRLITVWPYKSFLSHFFHA